MARIDLQCPVIEAVYDKEIKEDGTLRYLVKYQQQEKTEWVELKNRQDGCNIYEWKLRGFRLQPSGF